MQVCQRSSTQRLPDTSYSQNPKWGFPKIRGTFLGGPHNKNYDILGSILRFPFWGKYQVPGNQALGPSGYGHFNRTPPEPSNYPYPGAPCLQMISTLGPNVYESTYIGPFGAAGLKIGKCCRSCFWVLLGLGCFPKLRVLFWGSL